MTIVYSGRWILAKDAGVLVIEATGFQNADDCRPRLTRVGSGNFLEDKQLRDYREPLLVVGE